MSSLLQHANDASGLAPDLSVCLSPVHFTSAALHFNSRFDPNRKDNQRRYDSRLICTQELSRAAGNSGSLCYYPFGSLLTLAHRLQLKQIRLQKLRQAGISLNTSFSLDSERYQEYQQMSRPELSHEPGHAFLSPDNLPSFNRSGLDDVEDIKPEIMRCWSLNTDLEIGKSAAMLDFGPFQENEMVTDNKSENKRDLAASELQQRKYHCNHCSYQTDNRAHMRRHQTSLHDADKPFRCYVCRRDFARSDHVRIHFVSMHSEIPYDPTKVRKPKQLESVVDQKLIDGFSESPEVMAKVGDVRVRIRSFKGVIQSSLMHRSWEKYCRLVKLENDAGCCFRCLQCMYSGVNVWHMKLHYLSNHTNLPVYMCRVCHYSTGTLERLTLHMTDHGELFCHSCPFSSTDPKQYEVHRRLCSGTSDHKAPQCPVCGECYPDHAAVKSHAELVHGRLYCERCECIVYGVETLAEHQCSEMATSELSSLRQPADSYSEEFDGGRGASSEIGIFDDSHLADEIVGNIHSHSIENEDALCLSNLHFKRSADQTYCCHVKGCDFRATWKKSVELHELSYHNGGKNDAQSVQLSVLMADILNCPFCPTYRTFRYRRSFEKHLQSHGFNYYDLYPFGSVTLDTGVSVTPSSC